MSASSDGTIEFGSGDSTAIGCPEGNVSGPFGVAVGGAETWERDDDELILTGERAHAVLRRVSRSTS